MSRWHAPSSHRQSHPSHPIHFQGRSRRQVSAEMVRSPSERSGLTQQEISLNEMTCLHQSGSDAVDGSDSHRHWILASSTLRNPNTEEFNNNKRGQLGNLSLDLIRKNTSTARVIMSLSDVTILGWWALDETESSVILCWSSSKSQRERECQSLWEADTQLRLNASTLHHLFTIINIIQIIWQVSTVFFSQIHRLRGGAHRGVVPLSDRKWCWCYSASHCHGLRFQCVLVWSF